MIIRTFQKQKNLKKNLKILAILIVGSIIVAKISDTIYTKFTEFNNIKEIQIGSIISFAGQIENENNFPLYTHKITNKQGIFFLKSSKINLNTYIGKGDLEINGEIKDIKKDNPIIEISSIKFPKQGLIIKDNTYLFIKDYIYLDFSQQPKLSAQKTDKEIEVFFDKNKIFSMENFLCSRVLRQKDCSYLIEDYGKSLKENFDSYRGYTYYKHGTGLRTMFDGKTFGYVFKNIEEETMLNISNIIRIIDKDFIIENKEVSIRKACAEKGETLDKLENSSIKHEDDDNVSIIIENKNNSTCKITFDIRNERNITDIKISK